MPEQVRAKDLINEDVLQELTRVKTELVGITEAFNKLMAATIKTDEQLKKNVTTNKQLADNVKAVTDNSNKKADVEKELDKIDEKHYQTLTKMVAARSEENKKLEEAIAKSKQEAAERKNAIYLKSEEYKQLQLNNEAKKLEKQALEDTKQKLKQESEERKKSEALYKSEKINRDAAINSTNGLKAANKLLRDERDNLIRTDKNYEAELKRLNAEINKNDKAILEAGSNAEKQKGSIGNYKSVWEGMVGVFAAVTGGLASLGITWKLYHNILATSHTQLEKYEAMMTGVEFATKAFFKTLRAGTPDLETFIGSIKEAYERGKQYEEGLQLIEKRQRSINFIRGEEKQKLAELDEAIRDKSKSNDERLKAGIEVEDRLKKGYEQEKILREQNVEIELKALNLKGKTIEQAKEIIKQYLREDAFQPKLREDAEKLNELLLEKQKRLANVKALTDATTDERAKAGGKIQQQELQKEIDLILDRNDSTAKYATLIRELEGDRGKTRVDKTVDAIQKETDAENAFYYENKRIINTINGLKASSVEDNKKNAESNIKINEDESKKNLSNWEKQFTQQEKWTDEYNKDVKDQAKIQEQYNTEITKNKEETEKQRQDADHRTWLKKKALIEEEKAKEIEKYEAISMLANGFFDLGKTLGDNQISQLEYQKEKELKNAGDNAKKKEKIEADYAKKVAKVKLSIAIADKLQALFNIKINTAEAVTKAGAQLGAFGVPIATWLKIQGLIQAGIVLAQPLPKFFKGVRNFKGGLAEVGELGAELVETKQGQMFLTPDKATKMLLPPGSNVYTHEKTIEKLREMDSSKVDVLIKEQRLTRKAIANQQHRSTEITADGWIETTRKVNSRTTHIDKYFRN